MGRLVLTRRKGEKLIFGEGEDRIVVEVAEIRGDKVRLAVVAPEKVKIMRDELEGKVAEENKAAAKLGEVKKEQSGGSEKKGTG